MASARTFRDSEGEPITVLGAGTGFGVSCLARSRGRAVALATEAGHAGFAPGDEREIAVLRILAQRFGHVSTERILSGPGIENLHAALAQIAGRPAPVLGRRRDRRAPDERRRLPRGRGHVLRRVRHGGRRSGAGAWGTRRRLPRRRGSRRRSRRCSRRAPSAPASKPRGGCRLMSRRFPTRLILSEDAAYLGAAAASLEFRPDAP
ncbi:MAG: glucokinase [Rhizomicrobium sp.]